MQDLSSLPSVPRPAPALRASRPHSVPSTAPSSLVFCELCWPGSPRIRTRRGCRPTLRRLCWTSRLDRWRTPNRWNSHRFPFSEMVFQPSDNSASAPVTPSHPLQTRNPPLKMWSKARWRRTPKPRETGSLPSEQPGGLSGILRSASAPLHMWHSFCLTTWRDHCFRWPSSSC